MRQLFAPERLLCRRRIRLAVLLLLWRQLWRMRGGRLCLALLVCGKVRLLWLRMLRLWPYWRRRGRRGRRRQAGLRGSCGPPLPLHLLLLLLRRGPLLLHTRLWLWLVWLWLWLVRLWLWLVYL